MIIEVIMIIVHRAAPFAPRGQGSVSAGFFSSQAFATVAAYNFPQTAAASGKGARL